MGTGKSIDGGPELSVVIVSYNTCDLTCQALRSLAETTAVRHEVILVDNASSDGSAVEVAKRFAHVRILRLEENIGFAGANNLAATFAAGQFLLLLNPDTIVLPGAVDRLIEFARRVPDARIWGGRALYENGHLNPTSCWRRMTIRSVFFQSVGLSRLRPKSQFLNPETYPSFDRGHEREVDIVSGSFFLIEREFWRELGGFDPRFFVYGEEADLCLRARVRGARPAVTPDATIVHLEGRSRSDAGTQRAQVLAARIGLARRHMSPLQRNFAIGLIRMGAFLRFLSCRFILRSENQMTRAEATRSVWSRRQIWWNGY